MNLSLWSLSGNRDISRETGSDLGKSLSLSLFNISLCTLRGLRDWVLFSHGVVLQCDRLERLRDYWLVEGRMYQAEWIWCWFLERLGVRERLTRDWIQSLGD